MRPRKDATPRDGDEALGVIAPSRTTHDAAAAREIKMPRITVELLRKRSEHNEGIISTLEEISLHQEELEKIEVIGTLCRKLRILYLQNNIIEKIEDLTHMKELRYLNLALNNVHKIEGLSACEFLEKLDLTVNFVDFDELEESIDHLKALEHLRELYMLGNPCQSNWPEEFREYVIASLPQLQLLDGKEVHRSDRIKALQVFPLRQQQVRQKAREVRARKAEEAAEEQRLRDAEAADKKAREAEKDVIDVINGESTDVSREDRQEPAEKKSIMASDEKLPYTPGTRRDMYLEIAEQKEEEEARRRENMPRERDMEKEHEEALRKTREREQSEDEGRIRQCNEGKWDFRIEDAPLDVIVEVDLPKFLDTSLVDVDVHPSYVSIVAKNKLFRLRFPELVHSDAGKAERSKVTGTLRLTLPKAHVTATQQLRAQQHREEQERQARATRSASGRRSTCSTNNLPPDATTTKTTKPKKLSDELLEDFAKQTQLKGSVQLRGLVAKARPEDDENEPRNGGAFKLKPVASKSVRGTDNQEDVDDELPPLLF